jgi:hypothetical protein
LLLVSRKAADFGSSAISVPGLYTKAPYAGEAV